MKDILLTNTCRNNSKEGKSHKGDYMLGFRKKCLVVLSKWLNIWKIKELTRVENLKCGQIHSLSSISYVTSKTVSSSYSPFISQGQP